jgi:hypothetical protein
MLEHCLEGRLQEVLEEILHALINSEVLQGKRREATATEIGLTIHEALLRRPAHTVEHIGAAGGAIKRGEHRLRTTSAARPWQSTDSPSCHQKVLDQDLQKDSHRYDRLRGLDLARSACASQ